MAAIMSGLYKVRRADGAELQELGPAAAFSEVSGLGSSTNMSETERRTDSLEAGDSIGLQPMLDRLDPAGLLSSEDVVKSPA